jgi:hypothetical protein
MRDNWLSNRVFKSYDDILDHCCFAWNKLIDMPWKIMSIGTRDWVYRSHDQLMPIGHNAKNVIHCPASGQLKRPLSHAIEVNAPTAIR